jgi:hypothetical protein
LRYSGCTESKPPELGVWEHPHFQIDRDR